MILFFVYWDTGLSVGNNLQHFKLLLKIRIKSIKYLRKWLIVKYIVNILTFLNGYYTYIYKGCEFPSKNYIFSPKRKKKNVHGIWNPTQN